MTQTPSPKVCVITHSPSPYQVEFFDSIARAGKLMLEVIYLYPRDPDRLWQDSPPAHEHAVYDGSPEMAEGLAKGVQEADLLVINYFKHPLVDRILPERAEAGAPWVFWGERPRKHGLELLSRIYRKWKLKALRRSSNPIWGIGEMAVEAYSKEFGLKRPYVNLPYYSDLKRFHHPERVAPERVPTFLFSGSLIPRKGVDLVAKAFARLAEEGVRAKLKIMGAGDLEGSLRQELAMCSDRVEFIGFQDWQALPGAYAAADILCVPSRYDGWGLVVPEGLAAGLPVISTTQTGAAVEFIEVGRNGWLVPPDDEDALYHVMRQAAVVSPERMSAMSRAAVQSVAEHHLEIGAQDFVAASMAAMQGE